MNNKLWIKHRTKILITLIFLVLLSVAYLFLKQNRTFMLYVAKNDWGVFQYANLELQKDIIKDNGWLLNRADDRLQHDKDVILTAVESSGSVLCDIDNYFKSDKEIVLAAVKDNGYALRCASGFLRSDREIVLSAVKHNGYSLEYASDTLKSDKDIVLAAVKNNGYALKYASEDLKSDKDIVLVAVKNNGYALEYASKDLKLDTYIVFGAVKNNGYALKYADFLLKGDRHIVVAAANNDKGALKFARVELQKDLIKDSGWYLLEYASNEVKSDREFILYAVEKDWHNLQYADIKLRIDPEIILAAVKQDWRALQYITKLTWGYLALIIAIYLIPTIIGLFRSHQSRLAIFFLNIFLGWTIIGWFIALIWCGTGVWRNNNYDYELISIKRALYQLDNTIKEFNNKSSS